MMKRRHLSHRSELGGVLGIALVMTMLGGIIMASWVTLGFARSMQASNAEAAMKRRLSLGNSKALTRQFGYEQLLQSGNSMNGNLSDSLGAGAWGSMNTGLGFLDTQPFSDYPATSYPLVGYSDTLFPFNHTGLRGGPSFISPHVLVRDPADDSIDPYNHYVFVKSASPLAGGDALTYYQKATNQTLEIQSSGNIQVLGRLVVRDPRSFFPEPQADRSQKIRIATRCRYFYIQKHDELNLMTGTSLSNGEITSSNQAAMPSTNGFTDSVDMPNAFRGQLNVINNPGNPKNSLYHRQQEEFDSGTTALLTLNSPLAYGTAADPVQVIQYESNVGTQPLIEVRPPGWPSGYGDWSIAYIRPGHASLPNVRITSAINQVVFEGQTSSSAYNAAASMAARIVLLDGGVAGSASGFPRYVHFTRENARNLILGIKHAEAAPIDFKWVGPATPAVPNALTLDWRLYLVNENRPIEIYMPSGTLRVAITGGIMTNWSFIREDAGASDMFTISPVWNPSYRVASILPRDAWLESYFTLLEP
jgi:hypothetical protein